MSVRFDLYFLTNCRVRNFRVMTAPNYINYSPYFNVLRYVAVQLNMICLFQVKKEFQKHLEKERE